MLNAIDKDDGGEMAGGRDCVVYVMGCPDNMHKDVHSELPF